MKIYVASSWRNTFQPFVVELLRQAGNEVYDFRHPRADDDGFHWNEIDPDWQQWTVPQFRDALDHPLAVDGFDLDWEAIEWAEMGVLVLPCGRSAHLEAGVMVGQGKPVIAYLTKLEPELMYRMFSAVLETPRELMEWVTAIKAGA